VLVGDASATAAAAVGASAVGASVGSKPPSPPAATAASRRQRGQRDVHFAANELCTCPRRVVVMAAVIAGASVVRGGAAARADPCRLAVAIIVSVRVRAAVTVAAEQVLATIAQAVFIVVRERKPRGPEREPGRYLYRVSHGSTQTRVTVVRDEPRRAQKQNGSNVERSASTSRRALARKRRSPSTHLVAAECHSKMNDITLHHESNDCHKGKASTHSASATRAAPLPPLPPLLPAAADVVAAAASQRVNGADGASRARWRARSASSSGESAQRGGATAQSVLYLPPRQSYRNDEARVSTFILTS
jgi:hypothetical protein